MSTLGAPSVVPCASKISAVILRRLGKGTGAYFAPTGFSTDGPRSMTSGAAMALRDHGLAVNDLIESAHHLSAIGRRKTLLTLMTVPSAVATL